MHKTSLKDAITTSFRTIHRKTENHSNILKKGDVWFIAVMLRGFIELYQADKNETYLDSFSKSLDYAWGHDGMRKDCSTQTSAERPRITEDGYLHKLPW